MFPNALVQLQSTLVNVLNIRCFKFHSVIKEGGVLKCVLYLCVMRFDFGNACSLEYIPEARSGSARFDDDQCFAGPPLSL